MRTGEVVRAYLVARWISVRFRSILPSRAVERLLDGIILTAAIGLTTSLLPLPARLTQAAEVLGAIILMLTLGFVYLVLRTARRKGTPGTQGTQETLLSVVGASRGLLQALRRMISEVAEEIGRLGTGKLLSEAGFYSLLLLASQALSFWLIIRAAGFGLSVWAGAAVLLIVDLGAAIPNAPGSSQPRRRLRSGAGQLGRQSATPGFSRFQASPPGQSQW